MSQLKVNAIRATAASSDAITLVTDGTCTAKVTNNLSNKNLIINGAMNFHQRGGTTTGDNVYLLDRWHIYCNPTGKHTVSQDTEAPVGFKYSMKWTSASAYTPTSGNYFYTGQRIEGHNWDQMEYGTANAKTCTISFWARSSITGTWSGILKNNAQDRTYPWEYTISSANTWEKKTVTIPGCTDGTWLSGNNAGAWVYFCIGSSASGTTYLGSANSWQNSNLIGTTGSNSLVNTNGATLYITGVQLEVGDYATDFEHRLYGDELARCQRYYENITGPDVTTTSASETLIGVAQAYTTARALANWTYKVQKRAYPSVSTDTASDVEVLVSGTGWKAAGSFGGNSNIYATRLDVDSVSNSPMTAGHCCEMRLKSDGRIHMDAEL